MQKLMQQAANAAPPGWPRDESPFHAGEQALQARAGARDRIERIGRKIIRDFMLDQHRALFAELPFLVIGALDRKDRPWASILAGPRGFISSPDSRTLRIDARPSERDPLAESLVAGAPVGLLGIQLETRRRNRVNGTVVETDDRGFVVRVDQSFGNCPQYIQARKPVIQESPSAPQLVHAEGAVLSAGAAALVRQADTFFIATASPAAREDHPVEGADVSHRGGKPGFVRVTAEHGRTVLTSPDFAGNSQFNTFGNLALNPRAGLVFIDFASGDLLSLTGEAEVIWEGPELEAFSGAERLLRFRVAEGAWIRNAVPLHWSAPQQPPQLAATGSWENVESTIRADDPRVRAPKH
jgi:predicted pyridoxine 5'-phosphate oxidase superfamily flavin-nucleotide-binding protein